MKATRIAWFLLALVAHAAHAQRPAPFTARNAVYTELLGTGIAYSLKADRILLQTARRQYGVRIGFGVYGQELGAYRASGEVYGLTGTGNHHVEWGLGAALGNRRSVNVWRSINRFNLRGFDLDTGGEGRRIDLVPSVGYRYQKPTGGMLYRVTFSPLVNFARESDNFIPWGGISVGRSF